MTDIKDEETAPTDHKDKKVMKHPVKHTEKTEGESARDTQQAAHEMMSGFSVLRWLIRGTVKQLPHSTCHCGPLHQWLYTHQMENHKC